MNYGQCLIALDTGEVVIAAVSGVEIPVIISAVSTRRRVVKEKDGNRLVGEKYLSAECRGVHDNAVYHLRTELLTRRMTHTEAALDEMMSEEGKTGQTGEAGAS